MMEHTSPAPAACKPCEGSRFYKINGNYYIFTTRPPNSEYVLKSATGPFGPYTMQSHHRVGNQRRVYLREVLEFAKKRDKERLAALDLLARMRSKPACTSGMYSPKAARMSEECSSHSPGGLRPGPNALG